ncbi:hypothetical protein PAXRUDRAFT_823587 [Paxillus rubicundulus Ve08.2h10]|uniref:Uncharacterized protein n=1 Tax=Paxillus rubicundulus Ve08.2h10 TaxID=930991 RepID=A0A0D0DJP3_9AGAM|nr:hypothetical protein PAXRUDRAFT_823587 [Paxillus rubicundulus Ve08.2h10]
MNGSQVSNASEQPLKAIPSRGPNVIQRCQHVLFQTTRLALISPWSEFTFSPPTSPTMGQLLACSRRSQLTKFADEEPKSPYSPYPVHETVYIAVMGSTGSGKTTVCRLVDFDDV